MFSLFNHRFAVGKMIILAGPVCELFEQYRNLPSQPCWLVSYSFSCDCAIPRPGHDIEPLSVVEIGFSFNCEGCRASHITGRYEQQNMVIFVDPWDLAEHRTLYNITVITILFTCFVSPWWPHDPCRFSPGCSLGPYQASIC